MVTRYYITISGKQEIRISYQDFIPSDELSTIKKSRIKNNKGYEESIG